MNFDNYDEHGVASNDTPSVEVGDIVLVDGGDNTRWIVRDYGKDFVDLAAENFEVYEITVEPHEILEVV